MDESINSQLAIKADCPFRFYQLKLSPALLLVSKYLRTHLLPFPLPYATLPGRAEVKDKMVNR